MANLEWVFGLVDQISGPARAAATSLAQMSHALEAAKQAQQALDRAVGKSHGAPGGGVGTGGGVGAVASGARDVGAATKSMGFGAAALELNAVLEIAGRLKDVVASAASAAMSMGQFAVATAVAKQNLRMGLETMLGSKAAAADVAKQISTFAAVTPFEEADVAGTIKGLLAAGYSAKEAFAMFKGLGDVSALQGFNPEVLSGMTRALMKLRGDTRLTGDVLQQLSDTTGGMVGKGRVFEQLAKLTGKDVKTLEKEMAAGKIDAATGAKAIMEAIRVNLSGGALGGLMAKMGQEIPGLLSTIKDTLTKGLIPDVDDSAGLKSFRAALKSFADAASEAVGPLAKAVGGLIDATFGGLFDSFGGAAGKNVFAGVFAAITTGITKVTGFINAARPVVGAFVDGLAAGFRAAWPAIKAVGEGLSKAFGGGGEGMTVVVALARQMGEALATVLVVVGAVVAVMGALSAATFAVAAVLEGGLSAAFNTAVGLAGAFVAFFAGLPGQMMNIGAQLVAGLYSGITGAWGGLLAQFSALIEMLPAGVRQVLRIQSPSRVMAELGGYTAEGFAVGVDAGAPDAQSAMAGLVSPPSVAAASAAGAAAGAPPAAGGGITVNVEMHVASSSADPKAVAAEVSQSFGAQFSDLIERLALGRGALAPP